MGLLLRLPLAGSHDSLAFVVFEEEETMMSRKREVEANEDETGRRPCMANPKYSLCTPKSTTPKR